MPFSALLSIYLRAHPRLLSTSALHLLLLLETSQTKASAGRGSVFQHDCIGLIARAAAHLHCPLMSCTRTSRSATRPSSVCTFVFSSSSRRNTAAWLAAAA